MSIFDLLIVQPIFNVLLLIYGLVPGGDFGLAVVFFTVLVRLAMWPLVKKQLHQTKVMRQIQPELKKIKVKSKGNRQLEAQLMMELYRERGVNPFSSIGLILVQLPIFIALYRVIVIMTQQREAIAGFAYQPLQALGAVHGLIQNPAGVSEKLFGVINLAQPAFSAAGTYLPAAVLAVLAAALQYVQSRQITPKPAENKRLRDLLKSQAKGDSVDSSEINAAVSNRMLTFLPIMTLVISLYLPGALVLYFAASSLVAVVQQHIVLGRDTKEMENLADKPGAPAKSAAERARLAQPAQLVKDSAGNDTSKTPKPPRKRSGKRRKRR
ncbi:MAG: YidC/Oxa1 family membrane protein insertase [Candidatus Chaera renei]|uniref:YidC/Oxa1 family membrane protein insertase n=1 Tax=Candidatus Chaera renei TaxID=2506947 RepID=A0A4Q0AJ45_9BACT|nr:MAG: YidC/Oxa1 family membrane protein insertase [Candidatus Chaera renei]